MKRITAIILMVCMIFSTLRGSGLVSAQKTNEKKEEKQTESIKKQTDSSLDIQSEAAVLLEGSTGEVIYEKNKDKKLKPASITKIMTLLLIFEAIDEGKIALTDEVSVSEHAASMGGSQVYLEPYEKQTVDTMIKCISVVSANDACVAMAEYVAGSEEEFVAKMNEKAKALGMNNTHFVNCCGLDVDDHYSSAYDVALMSKELIMKHPEITNYSTIWMDTITHVTKKGSTEFGLSNTNKLIKSYNGITGLKTGSTSLAKYCLSATAKRDGMDMIAVVMAAPETKLRFQEAAKLLDYGFANCRIYTDDHADLTMEPVSVVKGVEETIICKPEKAFSYICLKDKNPEQITKEVVLSEKVTAPVEVNQQVGTINYYYNGELIGSVAIISTQSVKKAKFKDYLGKVFHEFLAY